MSLAADLASLVIAGWNAALNLRFLTLAGTTCLIYDHCVTFEQEASIHLLPYYFTRADT